MIYDQYDFLHWLTSIWKWLFIISIISALIIGTTLSYMNTTFRMWLNEKINELKEWTSKQFDLNYTT